MRALILHSRYLSGAISGENSVVDDEYELLRSAGHDVTLYAPSVDVEKGRARAAVGAVWSRSHCENVRRLVNNSRPDVVHVHSFVPALSPAVLRAIPEGTPTVMTLHNYRYSCLSATFLRDGRVCEDCLGRTPVRGVLHRCYRGSIGASAALATSLGVHRALRSFDRVSLFLAVSEFVRAKHVEAGMSPNKIRVKANFSYSLARRRGPGEYLLALGRLSPEKGLDTVVAAARESGSRLLVVGDGPERSALQQKAGPETTFIGAVGRDEVPGLLGGARALVFPSVSYEGAPRSILEAFAAGVGVIASRIGGIPELLSDPSAGCLVRPDNTKGWSQAFERFKADDQVEAAGAAAYRLWQTNFSPPRALEALESAYEAAQ